MSHRDARIAGLAAALVASLACGGAPEKAPASGAQSAPAGAAGAEAALAATPLPSPAGADSGEPFLAGGGDRAWLTWIERRGQVGEALLFAAWDGASWSAPRPIAEGVPFFVNWADTPSLLAMADGTLVAHWLQKAGGDTYAYHVMLSWSADGGASWSAPVSPHEDRSATEHGFVSLVDLGPGRFGAAWLDGRQYATGAGSSAGTALMYAEYLDGRSRGERVLDTRVCDCCQTAAAATPAGVVIAYRDRSPEEVRDIARVIVRPEPEAAHAAAAPPAGAAAPLGRDGWKIPGCPVNGPAIAASGDRVIAAWYTGGEGTKRVFAALSGDAGATFGAPIRLDLGEPAGRVDVEWLPDGSALVIWIEDGPGDGHGAGAPDGTGREAAADDAARIMARVVGRDATAGDPLVLARTRSARASGFPRLARAGDDLLMAWTDPAVPPRVQILRIAPRPRPGTGRDIPSGAAPRS